MASVVPSSTNHPHSLTPKTVSSPMFGGKQPDISYHPNRDKWQKRTAQRLAETPSLLSMPLPDGFPKKLQSTLVWEGKDWKNEAQWVYSLTSEQLKEIDDAVKHFHCALNFLSTSRSIYLYIFSTRCSSWASLRAHFSDNVPLAYPWPRAQRIGT